jgi:hypothetical protein
MRSAALSVVLALGLGTPGLIAAQSDGMGRLSNEGVVRATAMVDSVFLDRTRPLGRIEAGDWASYLLARLGTGPIPDSLGIEVTIDSTHIEVRGRLQDLPPEARALLGPLAAMVDSSTVVAADVILERTGPQVARFWLRALFVNGYRFPELLLSPMMAQVGRRYEELTASGRDLYVQIPPDGAIALTDGAVTLSISNPSGDPTSGRPRPPQER